MSKTTNAQLDAEKPTIKILLYTDNPDIARTNDRAQLFGLGSMLDRLEAHAPTFAKVEPTLISRNPDDQHPAAHKLDTILNDNEFDEIWFFGMHQANTEDVSLIDRRGGPESELSQNEIDALKEWMRVRADGRGGGGVLMAGDHSSEPADVTLDPNTRCAKTSGFLGLGRAIGRGVPRAGLLRRWEGPPSNCSDDSFSTIFNFGFQLDELPQHLNLKKVNADGDPDPNGQPHPLFFYKEGQFIEVFPDHAHEGAVIIPDEAAPLDDQEWPIANGKQPRPQVVAFSTEARRGDPLNVIATYNGDLAGVGRIVADSTWHHYMNVNLTSFPHPAPVGSVSDQIGQFYANLAIWLAPQSKRLQMSRAMLHQLAIYDWFMECEFDLERTGATVRSVQSKVASPCEIHEFWKCFTPREYVELYAAFENESQLPSRNRLLGSLVKSYQKARFSAESAASEAAPMSIENVVVTGFEDAFNQHRQQLQKTLEVLSTVVNNNKG